ncbi:MAG: hypothetical protein AB7N99_04940 [Simkaniaceae bacterium]
MKRGQIVKHISGKAKGMTDLAPLKQFFALLYQVNQRNLNEKEEFKISINLTSKKKGIPHEFQ